MHGIAIANKGNIETAKPTPCRYDRTEPDESYNGKVWLVIEINAMTADGSASQTNLIKSLRPQSHVRNKGFEPYLLALAKAHIAIEFAE